MIKARDAALSIVFVAGLAFTRAQHPTFRGRYFVDAPSLDVAFTPCGTHDKWLVVLDSSMLADAQHEEVDTQLVFVQDPKDTAALDSLRASLLPPPIFAVVQGDTSPRGTYGSQGGFIRRILVHQLDTIPTSERAKCT